MEPKNDIKDDDKLKQMAFKKLKGKPGEETQPEDVEEIEITEEEVGEGDDKRLKIKKVIKKGGKVIKEIEEEKPW